MAAVLEDDLLPGVRAEAAASLLDALMVSRLEKVAKVDTLRNPETVMASRSIAMVDELLWSAAAAAAACRFMPSMARLKSPVLAASEGR